MRVGKWNLIAALVISLTVLTVGLVPAAAPTISAITPARGSSGQQVTVAGSDFGATQGTSTVTFGEAQATPTS